MFPHIEFLYLAIGAITTVYCFRASTLDSFWSLLIIWLLFITAQVPELWDSPRNMAAIHAGAFFITLGALHNGISVRMQIITTAMTVLDAVWVIFSYITFTSNSLQFPYHLFWWQSSINILFVLMCLTVIVGCRNSIKIASYRKRNLDAGIGKYKEIAGGA